MISGFDVSFWQDSNYTPGKVDFSKMAQHGKFVIIRQGQGLWTDEDFTDYWRDAKAAGLVRMAYHFFTWDVSPEQQADKFYNDLKDDPPDKIRFEGQEISGYWGDFEWWATVPSNALELYGRFADRMKELTGLWPGIYTAPGFWMSYGSNADVWAQMPLWLARWGASAPGNMEPWQRLGKKPAIWQWGTPAIGLEVGCESKEVDANWFMGSEEELFWYKNGGETMPSVYDNYAKVLYMDENSIGVTAEMIKAYDLVIAKGVIGESIVPKFITDDLNLAYAADKPVMMFVESHTDIYVSWVTLPILESDPQWKYIKQAMYMANGTRRWIHGVMINCSQVNERGTNITIPDTWIAKVADYMLDLVAKFSGLPTFLYMDRNPINAWPGSAHIVGLIDRRGISTYSAVSNLVNGVPTSEVKPNLAYWGQKDWSVWLYKWNADTKTISGIYRGTKEALYAQLKFTPGTPVEPPPVPDPDPEPEEPPVDELTDAEKIEAVYQMVKEIYDHQKNF